MYSIKDDRWIEGPIMIEPRTGHSCCVLGTKLYAVCGSDNLYIDFGSIECLNI